MLRLSFLCCFLALGVFAQPGPGLDRGMPSVPWFDHVRQPLALSSEQGRALCLALRKGLLDEVPIEELLALAPKDKTPRGVFISLGDAAWPERTYFGLGYDFSSALRQVLTILRDREPAYAELMRSRLQGDQGGKALPSSWREKLKNPGHWSSMRLDIVQAALPIEGFSISRSRVMMCSLNGLAFRPGEGFAFTAEQMTGRYLIDAERRLNVRQIGDFIAESDNWGALKTWLSMANSEQEGRVCIFEYDSYFADEQGCRRLFRGHPVQSGISGRSPLAMSSAVAKRLLDCLQEDGSLKAPFPEWQSGRGEGGEFVSSQAELAIALARLAEMSGEQEFLLASKKIIKALLKNCRSSADKLMRFVLEEEELAPDERQQDPRLMLNVQGNALLCLALMETGLLAEEQYAQACREIMMYVSRQQLRSGDFIHSLVYPDMRRPLEEAYSEESRTETVALAALAMRRYAEYAGESRLTLIKRYELSLKFLLLRLEQHKELAALPLSPWLAELLGQAETLDDAQSVQLGRLALAASLQVEKEPAFPDLFGLPRSFPSMSLAAEQTWIVASLCQFFLRQGKKELANDFLADAWPLWVFQQQARIEPAAASALPRPELYYDFFRDHLEDFGFDLNGQSTQMLSMLAIAKCLSQMDGAAFPKRPEDLRAWQKNWRMIEQRPFCLDQSLVRKSAEGETPRHSSGSLERGTSVTVQAKGGKMVGGEPQVTGRVLERKSRAGGRTRRGGGR
ncbi:MAG: hypothetical protein PHG44_01320 [Lentisphaeria bacterium]|nr:hypothetical protein [Lentisphaeria bacterium]NLZ60840.1 hypothetical protein [Lentisphaerota bacterium]